LTRTQRQLEAVRQGDVCLRVQDPTGRPWAGVPVSVEQESHEFPFGCVVPDLSSLADADRRRYHARLDEVFQCLIPAGMPPPGPRALRVDVAERVRLGHLRRRLDQLAASGLPLHVHVWGEAVGMTPAVDVASLPERDLGRRVAELYTLCFAHPAVSGVFWNGLADGDPGVRGGGLLRRDLAPRYAHLVLRKLLGSLWHTRAAGVTDAAGLFRFRGFFGDYRAVADVGEPPALVGTFAFHRGSAGASPAALVLAASGQHSPRPLGERGRG
jgi:hypothetical protein